MLFSVSIWISGFCSPTLIAVWMPGPLEWALIAGVALLIFGKRLPDVARSVGKSVVEFKKGLKGVQDDVDQSGKENESPKSLPTNNSSTNTGTS